MISLKSKSEIERMRVAGYINALAHMAVRDAIKVGTSTLELDAIAEKVIRDNGAIPTFKGLYGFPNAACISVNDCLIHGIPNDYRLQEGDIVSIDLGSTYQGLVGDSARTWAVGQISDEAKQLIEVTRQSFFEGLKMAKEGNRLGDISHAIGSYAKSFGYGVTTQYTGHGVGHQLHEDPPVPNDGTAGKGVRLKAGMTLAVEPMVNLGTDKTIAGDGGWFVRTADGKISAHYENTFLITTGEPEIFTLLDDEK